MKYYVFLNNFIFPEIPTYVFSQTKKRTIANNKNVVMFFSYEGRYSFDTKMMLMTTNVRF